MTLRLNRAFRALAVLTFTAALGGLAMPAHAEDAPKKPEETVFATIDGKPITGADLGMAAAELGDQLQRIPPQQQRQALIDIVVEIKMMSQAARESGLDKKPDVEQHVAFAVDRTLRSEYLRDTILAKVSEDAAKKRYDEEIAKFVPGDEIHVQHILVKTEDEAKAIIADLDKGGDFAAIAKEKSQDPGSAPNGGDLGFIGKGKTVKSFEEAAFALKAGTYTEKPVQSEYGWHVIKVTETRKEAAPTFEAEAERIRQDLIREAYKAEMDKLKAAHKIEILPPPPPPAPAAPATPAQPAQ
ncbi:MAG: peptidylprolyl isomerase [Rhizobiales bacterium]|nr:peptidylprolyl isomerase [Hyphomicrobiales bacterium]